jgi:hypothetical protein
LRPCFYRLYLISPFWRRTSNGSRAQLISEAEITSWAALGMTEIWRPCALGILEILLVGKVQVLLHKQHCAVRGLGCWLGLRRLRHLRERGGSPKGKDCNENEFHWMAFPMVN